MLNQMLLGETLDVQSSQLYVFLFDIVVFFVYFIFCISL